MENFSLEFIRNVTRDNTRETQEIKDYKSIQEYIYKAAKEGKHECLCTYKNKSFYYIYSRLKDLGFDVYDASYHSSSDNLYYRVLGVTW